MQLLSLCGLFVLTTFASAGLLHDKPHHVKDVLTNILEMAECARGCVFEEEFQEKWAPKCVNIEDGIKLGECYCRANAYQYVIDKCWEMRCGENNKVRKKVCIPLRRPLT